MRDFERINDLQKSRDRLIKAMYLAQKKLREDAQEVINSKPVQSTSLMTAALAVSEILFHYMTLEKKGNI